MEKLFAKIGQQHLEIEERAAKYADLLNLLARVVKGEIETSRVMVNLTDQTWMFVEPGTRPAMPATVNGLPNCVMAPEPVKVVITE